MKRRILPTVLFTLSALASFSIWAFGNGRYDSEAGLYSLCALVFVGLGGPALTPGCGIAGAGGRLRFAARFADFSVALETLALMRDMVAAGEVDALVPERVWQELARGLMEEKPSRMFEVLRESGALARLPRRVVQIAERIRILQIDGRRNHAVANCQHREQ